MVDVWLIFAQVVPWIEVARSYHTDHQFHHHYLLVTIIIVMIILIMKVLLHTVIDWMRTEDEGEDGRNINHHGKTITVGGKQDAVAADVEGVRLMT